MDAKITKQRLGKLLSYDWIKIVALAIAVIVFWSIIFTVTATQITPSQQFTVFNYYSNASLSDEFFRVYKRTKETNKFSYEIIEQGINDLTVGGIDTAYTLLEARFAISEGDIIFIPNANDLSTGQPSEEGGEPTYTTFMQQFFNVWHFNVYNVDVYLNGMREFVSAYYIDEDGIENNNYINGVFNEEKARADFIARVKKNKDKRFKKEEEIQNGVLAEFDRIEKYKNALIQFDAYLNEGVIELTPMSWTSADGKVKKEGNFAVNLCPDNNKTGELKRQVSYYSAEIDEYTAKDMHVMFFNLPNVENSFQYESLLYVNEVIAAALTATQQATAN